MRDILAELPRLPREERELIAKVLDDLETDAKNMPTRSAAGTRRADLHAGAWEVAADFDAPLPEGFWLGEES